MKTNKTFEQCEEYNRKNAEAISVGLMESWEPSDEEIKRVETIRKNELKLQSDLVMLKTLIRKAIAASNFASDLLTLELERQMDSWQTGSCFKSLTVGKINLTIEYYYSYVAGQPRFTDSYYRLVLSGLSRYDYYLHRSVTIYKDVSCKLKSDTTPEKVATWLNEKVGERIRYNNQQAQLETIKQKAQQKKAQLLKENEAAFKVLGVTDVYPGSGTTEGMILAKVQFALTSAEWHALAEWKKNLPTV